MNTDIEAIFLDHGNTLRVVVEDKEFASTARQNLMTLVGTQDTQDVFFTKLDEKWKAYRNWLLGNMVEASEKELWTRFMLPDYSYDMIAPLAGRLTRLWREREGGRLPPP